MSQYLDKTGLESFWGKVKSHVSAVESKLADYQTVKEAQNNFTTLDNAISSLEDVVAGKANSSHSHKFSEITNKPTTLSGYGITDAYTKTQVDTKVSDAIGGLGKVLNYKGTKATVSELPSSGVKEGDVYIVTADNSEHVWNGTAWEKFGPTVDLSGYLQASQITVTPSLTSGTKIGTITINGVTKTFYCQTDTDTKVTQTAVTENAELPILLASSSSGGTSTTKFKSGVTVNPSTGVVTATTFKGALTGKADSAGTADKLGSSTVGGTTTPIYLSSGVPTPLSYTIAKSVPSSAVFTDQNVAQTANTGSTAIPLLIASGATPATGKTQYASGVTVTPSTKTITATTFSGTATKATADADGNAITTTYLKNASVITTDEIDAICK